MAIFSAIVKKISKLLFVVSSLLLLFMTIAVTYDVLARYFIKKPTIWVNEVSGYMLVAVTFLAASYTLSVGGHVRVDVLYEKSSPRRKHIMTIISYLLTLGYIAALSYKGLQMVLLSYTNHWRASTLLGTPLFIPQAMIPLGGIVLVLQIVLLIADEISALRTDKTT